MTTMSGGNKRCESAGSIAGHERRACRKSDPATFSILAAEIPCSFEMNSLFRPKNSLFRFAGNLAASA
jgi:hypothetical protein